MVTCDACGSTYGVGEWPWCPHGAAKRFGDDPIDSYFDEHISTDGETITTRGQRRKLMAENALEVKPKRYSRPGARLFFDLGSRR
jgi:hypothetical protein